MASKVVIKPFRGESVGIFDVRERADRQGRQALIFSAKDVNALPSGQCGNMFLYLTFIATNITVDVRLSAKQSESSGALNPENLLSHWFDVGDRFLRIDTDGNNTKEITLWVPVRCFPRPRDTSVIRFLDLFTVFFSKHAYAEFEDVAFQSSPSPYCFPSLTYNADDNFEMTFGSLMNSQINWYFRIDGIRRCGDSYFLKMVLDQDLTYPLEDVDVDGSAPALRSLGMYFTYKSFAGKIRAITTTNSYGITISGEPVTIEDIDVSERTSNYTCSFLIPATSSTSTVGTLALSDGDLLFEVEITTPFSLDTSRITHINEWDIPTPTDA